MLSLKFEPPSPMITLIPILLRCNRPREPLPRLLYLALSPEQSRDRTCHDRVVLTLF